MQRSSMGLKPFILKHVTYQGRQPFIEHIVGILQKHVPAFRWRWDVLCATDYRLPQTRRRVFLRGVRASIFETVPAPLPAFGAAHILDFLGSHPSVHRSLFTASQRKNIGDYEQRICAMYSRGELSDDDVCVCYRVRSRYGEHIQYSSLCQ